MINKLLQMSVFIMDFSVYYWCLCFLQVTVFMTDVCLLQMMGYITDVCVYYKWQILLQVMVFITDVYITLQMKVFIRLHFYI